MRWCVYAKHDNVANAPYLWYAFTHTKDMGLSIYFYLANTSSICSTYIYIRIYYKGK